MALGDKEAQITSETTASSASREPSLERMASIAAAIERMLNTVCCRVDRLNVHLHVAPPGDTLPTRQPCREACYPSDAEGRSDRPYLNSEDDGRDTHSGGERGCCLVLRVGSLKLVDTSDCFLAPHGNICSAALDLMDPTRPVEITKSAFWTDVSLELLDECKGHARSESSWSPKSSHEASSVEQATSSPRSASAAADVDVRDAANVPLEAEFKDAGGEEWESQSEKSFHDPVDLRVDQDEQPLWAHRRRPLGNGIMLLGSHDGSGWSGKATLELEWAPIAAGGALRRISVAIVGDYDLNVALDCDSLHKLARCACIVEVAVHRSFRRARENSGQTATDLRSLSASMFEKLRPGPGLREMVAIMEEDTQCEPSRISYTAWSRFANSYLVGVS
jgi:hypothetical protein